MSSLIAITLSFISNDFQSTPKNDLPVYMLRPTKEFYQDSIY